MDKLLVVFVFFFFNYSFCQGDADLFRYSKSTIQGGARFEAMGGSFGALGADLSSSQINPAGFGRYSNSHFSAALSVTKKENSILFQGNTKEQQGNMVKLNTLGFVFVIDESLKQKGYLYSQFAFGYNKLENFKNSFSYEGQQYESLLDDFSVKANGISEEELFNQRPFSSFLAYYTYAINPSSSNPLIYSPDLSATGEQYHKREVVISGGMNEYFVSYSKNYLNTFYFGGNIGVRTINYDESIQHHEDVLDTIGTNLRSFDYKYHLNTKGNGLNLKLGAIFLPHDNLRIGLAFHTATYFNLTDKTDADMTSVFFNQTIGVNDSLKPIGDYNYRLRTPPKFIGSIAYIFGTKGCVNIDIEYINYKMANLRSTKDLENYASYSFTTENADAKKVLKSALNFRVGGELVLNSIFFIRAGMRISGNAYQSSIKVEKSTDKSYSGGLGYKQGKFVVDLSYRISSSSRYYTAFYKSFAEHELTTHGFVLSANYTFN